MEGRWTGGFKELNSSQFIVRLKIEHFGETNINRVTNSQTSLNVPLYDDDESDNEV